MSPLLLKELRALRLPALGALALALVPIVHQLWRQNAGLHLSEAFDPTLFTLVLWTACALIGAASWGGEFASNTLNHLLCQPTPRRNLLQTKTIAILIASAPLIIAIGVAADRLAIPISSLSWIAPVVFAATATPLVSRYTKTSGNVFWALLLLPTIINFILFASLLTTTISKNANAITAWTLILLGLAAYSHAHRTIATPSDLDLNAIDLKRQRARSVSRGLQFRKRSKWLEIVKKEIRLHDIAFAVFAACVAMSTLCILALLFAPPDSPGSAKINTLQWSFHLTRFFGLLIPLLVGVNVVASERAFGIIRLNLLAPTSIRAAWSLKLFVAYTLAILLFAGYNLLLDQSTKWFPNVLEPVSWNSTEYRGAAFMAYALLPIPLVSIGVIASSIAHNFVQSLSAAFTATVLCNVGLAQIATHIAPGTHALAFVLADVCLVAFATLGAFAGYRAESRSKKILALYGFYSVIALAAISGTTSLIHNRVWELALEETNPWEPKYQVGPFQPSVQDFERAGSKEFYIAPDRSLWLLSARNPSTWSDHARFQEFTPQRIHPATNWMEIVRTPSHPLLALNSKGELWRFPTQGVLTNRYSRLPDSWIDIAAGPASVAGIRSDGSLWIWENWTGFDEIPTPVHIESTNRWTALTGTRTKNGYFLVDELGDLYTIRYGFQHSQPVPQGASAKPPSLVRTPLTRLYAPKPIANLESVTEYGYEIVGHTQDGQPFVLTDTGSVRLDSGSYAPDISFEDSRSLALRALPGTLRPDTPIALWRMSDTNYIPRSVTAKEIAALNDQGVGLTPWTASYGYWRITPDGSVWKIPTGPRGQWRDAGGRGRTFHESAYHLFIPERKRTIRVGRIDL